MTLTDLSKFHAHHQNKMEPKSYDIKITALSVISITPYHIIEQHIFIFILIISMVNKRMTKLVIIQSCFPCIPVPYCFNNYSFTIQLEITRSDAICFVFLSHNFFDY